MSAAAPSQPPPPLTTLKGCAQALPPHLAALLNHSAAAAAQASAAVALPKSDDSLAANSGSAQVQDAEKTASATAENDKVSPTASSSDATADTGADAACDTTAESTTAESIVAGTKQKTCRPVFFVGGPKISAEEADDEVVYQGTSARQESLQEYSGADQGAGAVVRRQGVGDTPRAHSQSAQHDVGGFGAGASPLSGALRVLWQGYSLESLDARTVTVLDSNLYKTSPGAAGNDPT